MSNLPSRPFFFVDCLIGPPGRKVKYRANRGEEVRAPSDRSHRTQDSNSDLTPSNPPLEPL